MLERHSGMIINVSSIEGLRGYPPDVVYGVEGRGRAVTHSLGVEVARKGVKVDGIAPDLTNTSTPTSPGSIPPSGPTSGRCGRRSDASHLHAVTTVRSRWPRPSTGHGRSPRSG